MKLFLVDAYALIYRSYYAFIRNPRVNSKGMNTSAIFGFVNTLEELLRKENPSHIAVAFDPPGKTFRHEAYEEYKAQREATPEDIRMAVPIIKDIIDAYNIKMVEVAGFEADDVIGTISKKAEKAGFEVYMMTPDKDYGQLTTEKTFMYRPRHGSAGFDVLDAKAICKQNEIERPDQVIDMLGLMGDASDNIPGCPGVGPKTAQRLLKEFDNIENLLANTDKLKGKLKENIEEHKEQILFSKFLATIKTDMDIDFVPEEYIKEEINEDKLHLIFDELEFKSLLKRVLDIKDAPVPNTHEAIQGNLFSDILDDRKESGIDLSAGMDELNGKHYHFVSIDSEVKDLVSKLSKSDFICFDTETTGLNPIVDNIVGMSFSIKEGEAYYVPVEHDNHEKAKARIHLFKAIFEDERVLKIGQNVKFDIIALKQYDVAVKGKLFDTMIAHYLINPELRHNMDYMADSLLNYKTKPIEELIGKKGKNQLSMGDLKPEDISDYACEDADITLRLKNVLEKAIEKENLNYLFYEIETPLIYVLADMEYIGVNLNTEALKEYSKELTKTLDALEAKIYELAGEEFNVNSPKQVGEILFDKLVIVEKAKKTKTGQYVTSEEELTKVVNEHPIVPKILEQRGLRKLLSTYVDALPKLINEKTGKIHTSYNQTVTATGRLSSSDPNLQNIPIRDDQGRQIRKAFTADEGCTFFSADYSQIELRIMAHLSQDPSMVEAFNSDKDIHSATAAKIYKIALDDVTGDMRNKAKTANFGIIYGISVFGLSQRLDIPRMEAKELIDGYFESYPQVKEYMDKSIEQAKKDGYVETVFGRKRYLPDINSRNSFVRGFAERNAINAPIQGSAADIIKVAMNNIFRRFEEEKLESKMILQVHDELNFNVIDSELELVQKIVMEEMEGAYKLAVPLKADCGKGANWLEAH